MDKEFVEIKRWELKVLIHNRLTMRGLANLLYPNAKSGVSAATCLGYWLDKGVMPVEMHQRMMEIIQNTPLKEECNRYPKNTDPEEYIERNEIIYSKWLEGKHLSEIGKEYGLSRERVRQICKKIARRKCGDCWRWMSQFGSQAIALFINNNIHCEEDLHEWWGEGKKLSGTGVSLATLNEKLENPLVYVKKKRTSPRLIDLTGQRFGRLTVIKRAESKTSATRWECLCDCGKTTVVQSYYLRNGMTKSCGCLCEEYYQSLKGGGVRGALRIVTCRKCAHHGEVTGWCTVWNAITESNGYCHKGENR